MKRILPVLFILKASSFFAQVPPTWTVNPAAFQYQMTVTAKAVQGCVDLADTNNYIAAFVGSQCRGVVKTKTAAGSKKLGLLTVKSNIVFGEVVKFQVYKASANAVINVLDTLIFSQGASVGTLSNPFIASDDHAPTAIQLSGISIAENLPVGSLVANITASDIDPGSTFSYSITALQPEGTQFQLNAAQLKSNIVFNYEADSLKLINLEAIDGGGCTYTQTFTLHIINANDTPTVINFSQQVISDHQQAGSFMGRFSTIDEDVVDSYTYSLVSGIGSTDNTQFYISHDSLFNVSQINYIVQSVYHIRARSTDAGGLFVEDTFHLNIINVNDAPTDIILSNDTIQENQPSGTLIASMSVTDLDNPLDVHVITLEPGGPDNSKVTITGGNTLRSAVSYNYELQDTLHIKLRATDSAGAYYVKSFTIKIKNINDAPSDIQLPADSVSELQPAGTLVSTFSTTDEDVIDTTHIYTLVAGTGSTDNAMFNINGKQLLTASTFTFTFQTYSIRVKTTDLGGLSFEKVFSIKVLNANEAPTDILLDTAFVPEDNAPNVAVTKIKTLDPDSGDSFTYSLVSGQGDTDNSEFSVSGNDLVIKIKTNYDVKNAYHIRLQTKDAAGLTFQKAFEIQVRDISGNNIPLPSTNYISPNGDGKNDYWVVTDVDSYKEFALNIYDQFGQVVFSVPDGYHNEFDGMYQGHALPSGNYYYVFKKSGKTFKGNISIVN